MTRILVVGGSRSLSRAVAAALNDFAVKVVSSYPDLGDINYIFYNPIPAEYRHSEPYKKAMREQAKYREAGVQQRRKSLAKFHKEKRERMAHKQAQQRRSSFV